MKIIHFDNRYRCYRKKLAIGDEMSIAHGKFIFNNCVFVKVTRKGFNAIDMDTHRSVFYRPLYAIGMGGKEFPSNGVIEASFFIPEYFIINVKRKIKEKTS